ncbi:MAG: DUF2235 domain-containing protein [Kofleriaceae bacterium]
MNPTASHQTEDPLAQPQHQAALDTTTPEHEAPATTFTNQGAVPAPQAWPAASGPSASEQAFGGTNDKLRPDQHAYLDQIHKTDPAMGDKKANQIAAESRPLSQADRDSVIAIQRKISTMKPRRIDDPKNPNLVQIEISFDGTGEDREQTPDITDSNPARLDEGFEGPKHYEPGVASSPQKGLLGGIANNYEFATGAGFQNRIDSAYENLVTQINTIKGGNPAAEVVLVLAGFSRGAAEARAFVNELNKRGVPVRDSKQQDGSYSQHYATPKVGVMVLFDTVEMTPLDQRDLSIPANVENVLHLTARDEHRTTFPLTRATDPNHPNDDRITEVAMPGAHGDVGGGMPNAYSQISEQIARQYMVNAGVNIKPEAPDQVVDVNDPKLRLHNTGDGMFGMKRPVMGNHNPDPTKQ